MQLSALLVNADADDPFALLLFSCSLQMFTIKMQEGVIATSYSAGDKFHIDPMKLLPLERFTGGGGGGGGRGGGRGGGPDIAISVGAVCASWCYAQ